MENQTTIETESSRTPRETDTRDSNQRTYHDAENWLDVPDHIQKDFLGKNYKLGWLRIYLNGEEDYKSVGKKVNEGWEFVTSDEVPEMTVGYGYSKAEDRFENCIVRGDVALAKIPYDIWSARKEHAIEKNQQMNKAINERLMSMQDRRMPISNSSHSQTTVGGQRPTKFDEG